MGLNSFIKLFTPKDKVFYTIFEEVASNLSQMSALFKEAMHHPDMSKRMEMLQNLEDYEHKNDDATHRIFVELGRNFITPFDREDIHYLATSLDDVADYIWASAKAIITFNVDTVTETMKQFTIVIENSVNALGIAIRDLRNMKDLKSITDACVQVNLFENKADDLLDEALKKLFTFETNAIELMKRKDLYENMEIVTDKCEDAANVIESIIIKYS
jgi:predicted phosphate transport protein (TIGR00153 family)